MILKLECLLYQNIYILFHLFNISTAISTQTNPKSVLGEKNYHIKEIFRITKYHTRTIGKFFEFFYF